MFDEQSEEKYYMLVKKTDDKIKKYILVEDNNENYKKYTNTYFTVIISKFKEDRTCDNCNNPITKYNIDYFVKCKKCKKKICSNCLNSNNDEMINENSCVLCIDELIIENID